MSHHSNYPDEPPLPRERDEIRRYKDKLRRTNEIADNLFKEKGQLKREKTQLTLENNKLQDELKELKSSKQENEIKWKNSAKECDVLKKERENLLMAMNSQKEEFHKQIDKKQKDMDNMAKSHSEALRLWQTKNVMNENHITELKLKLRTKTIEQNNNITEKLETIELLQNNLKIEKKISEQLETDVKKLQTKLVQLKDQYKKERPENLKRQRKYFQDQNENNKRKCTAVSHTFIKQRNVMASGMAKICQSDSQLDDEFVNQLINMTKKLNRENQMKKWRQKRAVFNKMKEMNTKIDDEEKQMLQKRADGKHNCGTCSKAFCSNADLKRHITTKHGLNTNDCSKNEVQIFDIPIVTID